jgi:hypothetical protein
VGHAALAAAAAQPPLRRLIHFAFEDPAVYAHGDEPLFLRGEPAGWTTSVAWAPTAAAPSVGSSGSTGRCVGMGYASLPASATAQQPTPALSHHGSAAAPAVQVPVLSATFFAETAGQWEAEVFGTRHRLVQVGLQPLYDPAGERVKTDGE